MQELSTVRCPAHLAAVLHTPLFFQVEPRKLLSRLTITTHDSGETKLTMTTQLPAKCQPPARYSPSSNTIVVGGGDFARGEQPNDSPVSTSIFATSQRGSWPARNLSDESTNIGFQVHVEKRLNYITQRAGVSISNCPFFIGPGLPRMVPRRFQVPKIGHFVGKTVEIVTFCRDGAGRTLA